MVACSLHDTFAGVDDRVDQYYRELSFQMGKLDIVRITGVNEHGEWEGVVDTEGHVLSAAKYTARF